LNKEGRLVSVFEEQIGTPTLSLSFCYPASTLQEECGFALPHPPCHSILPCHKPTVMGSSDHGLKLIKPKAEVNLPPSD
jgi:hypothetical protein